MEKFCKKCGMALAVVLVKDSLDYHLMCAPEEEFQRWLDKYRNLDDKV